MGVYDVTQTPDCGLNMSIVVIVASISVLKLITLHLLDQLLKVVASLPRKLIVFVTHHHRDHVDGEFVRGKTTTHSRFYFV